MKLSELKPAPGARHARKRVGRGTGSGLGKTSTRGHKGQWARSGGGKGPQFEGGQTPLVRRLPKRGFHNVFHEGFVVVNVGALERFDAGTTVTPELLRQERLVRKAGKIKILGEGELTKPLTVRVDAVSKAAAGKIEQAGGKVEVS
ncbi:MAG TPA: 50S ribosomal protein L15 [Firmicutes bacterium]|nr:50S ribosomal protein L15 [Bacillota bacterium]